MQKFINNPENLTSELLEGLVLSNPDIITLEQGNLIVNQEIGRSRPRNYRNLGRNRP